MREEVSLRVPIRSLRQQEGVGGASDMEFSVAADERQREVLARRLGVPAVAAFQCRFRLEPPDHGGAVFANAVLDAEVERVCVVSLDAFNAVIRESFSVRFVPASDGDGSEDALDPDDVDEIPYVNGMIDLGEAAVEQLALGLDPYPRKPGAALDYDEADQVGERDVAEAERPNPFAILAGRRSGSH